MSSPKESMRHLFVYLHGHSDRPQDAAVVLASLDPDRRFVAVTPAGPVEERSGLSWFGSGPTGVDRDSIDEAGHWLAAEIAALAAEENVAPERVILGGFSQGGAMALATIAHLAKPAAAVVLHNSFLPEGLDYELEVPKGSVGAAYVQNSTDDEVVPCFMGESIAGVLSAAGARVTAETTPGGHGLTSRVLASTREWLADEGLAGRR